MEERDIPEVVKSFIKVQFDTETEKKLEETLNEANEYNRKEISEDNHYLEKLQEIKDEFSEGLSKLLVRHYNQVIIKYGNWKKYPRKVKKYLKKEQYWNLKESKLLKDNDIKVEFNF